MNTSYIFLYLSFSLFIISTKIFVFFGTTSVFSSVGVCEVFFHLRESILASMAPSTDEVMRQPSSLPNLPSYIPKIRVFNLIVDNNVVLSYNKISLLEVLINNPSLMKE